MREALSKQSAQLELLGKRINKKVLSMFEKAEQEYADLMSKKEIVMQDKAKIEAVIAELGQKKIEALEAFARREAEKAIKRVLGRSRAAVEARRAKEPASTAA